MDDAQQDMSAAGPLGPVGELLGGKRKAYFENLRTKHVPQYLFRAWSTSSGGGSKYATNSMTRVIPHRFMPTVTPLSGRVRHFYDLNEASLLKLAQGHFDQDSEIVSGFSSWTPSLHLVLCYARSMATNTNPHIAVMDTHNLDVEVLVWHCPHLIGKGHEEYLAWGPIRGRGYTAVRFEDLMDCGLTALFPQLTDESYRDDGDVLQFGNNCRHQYFGGSPRPFGLAKLRIAEDIASLFEDLFLPVFLALLCLETRSWYKARSDNSFGPVLIDQLSRIIQRKGLSKELEALHEESWVRPGQVDTLYFPDVQQWITLLQALVRRHKLVGRESRTATPKDIRLAGPRTQTKGSQKMRPQLSRPKKRWPRKV